MKSKMLVFLMVCVFSVLGNTGDLGSSIFAALMAQMASQSDNISVFIGSSYDDSHGCNHHHHHQYHSQLSKEASEYGLDGIITPVYYKGREIGRAWVSGSRAALHDLVGVVYVPGRYNRNIHFLIPVDNSGKRIKEIQVLGIEEN